MVWAHYKKYGRHVLPWRKTRDPYKILVSEAMLQQTQVDRVIPFYTKFIKKFPTARALARAPLSEVLKQWQGLGYNRRAKLLHLAAKKLQHISFPSYRTKMICAEMVQKLEDMPGVGSYTARAIAAFAFNQDVILVETNIRTAVMHHFFSRRSGVRDAEVAEVLSRVLPKGRACRWYSALMDYGAHLKRSGVSLNTRSAHYTKQSRFAGSLREARGALLRAYTQGITSRTTLTNLLGAERRAQAQTALRALTKEGLISGNLLLGGMSRLPQVRRIRRLSKTDANMYRKRG